MDVLGPETAGEQATRTDAGRFRVVTIVAASLAVAFALPHLMSIVAVRNFARMYSDLGGELPAVTAIVVSLGRSGALPVVLLVIDAAAFAGMYVLAKRYWIGLLFAPIFIYGAISAFIWWTLYMPMFQVITLIE